MDARMQKHRMMRWLGRVFVAFALVASCAAQGAVESVPGTLLFCNPYEMAHAERVVNPLGTNGCTYPTVMAAAQAWAVGKAATYDNVFHAGIRICYDRDPYFMCLHYMYVDVDPGQLGYPLYPVIIPVAVGCPDPTVNSAVPYRYSATRKTCEREVPDTLTITLSGGTEVEPSNGEDKRTLPFIATVIDQSTQKPTTNSVEVRISLKVNDPKSGGHDHGDSTRPRGGIAEEKVCASDNECWKKKTVNGAVVFNFNAPEASGTYTISATCEGCSNTATKPVDVKVNESKDPGWDHLTASSDYALVGGETGKKHHDNHYLTATASAHLKRLVREYNLAYPAGPVLYLNDASLVWGGRFDISGNWAGDHKNHRKGVVIDIRANQDPTAIPQARFDDFEKFAKANKAYASLHCAFSGPYVCPACLLDTGPNRHYHVRLLGQGIDK
jgi:hypothetical protein